MIKEIKIGEKTYGILLGFEALKCISGSQIKGISEMQLIEDVAVVGFDTYARRKKIETPSREQIIEWFDDLEVFMEVKDFVEDFSLNFTEKVEAINKAKANPLP